jgi:4-hydroxy-tetrahydrodipicolinate synthase
MVVNPYYSQLTDERIDAHYRKIADNSPLPVLLYNFPALTGQDLSIELVTRLAQTCPNIVGIKDTVDCISRLRRIFARHALGRRRRRHPGDLEFRTGSHLRHLPGIL